MFARYLRFFLFLFIGCNALYAQHTLVFAGSFNRDKNKEGITVFRLDTISGRLQRLSVFKGILNPSYLCLSQNGQYLYACTETQTPKAGSIAAFRVDAAKGKLTLLNSRKSSGENPVYIALPQKEKYLYSVNYTEAGIDVFPLAADGRIQPPVQVLAFDKGSGATERQAKAHTHSLQFAPTQDRIFVPDLGSDLIRCYQLDSSATQPIAVQTEEQVKALPATGPRHFTFHPDGQYAYCIEEIAGTVSAYRYKEGKLELLQHIPAHKDSLEEYNSADIHCSPDGRFLYASNRGRENNIAIFAIGEDGKLATIGYQSVLGEHPRIFAIDASGKFLVVANQISGNIVVFKRDRQSGLLHPIGQKVKATNVSCVQIKTYE